MTDHIKAARSIWGESAILPFAELERFYAIARAEALEEAAAMCEAYVAPGIGREMAEAIRKLKEQQHG